MEQFLKLPPAQKAAVLAGILVLLALGMYFLLVDPELGRAEQARNQLKKVEMDILALKEEASPEKYEALRQRKDELVEKDKENRKMLPAAEEIPDLIDGMQRDAVLVGLTIKRFDRLPEEIEDLYNAVPIRMTVEGSHLQFLQFLRIYAGNDRRVINLRDMSIERVPPDMGLLKTQLEASKPLDQQKKGEIAATPEAQLLESLELAEEGRKNTIVRATFVASAFVWTGKPAELIDGQARRDKGRKKRT
jgi:Tfp pilus assembly protein PilO